MHKRLRFPFTRIMYVLEGPHLKHLHILLIRPSALKDHGDLIGRADCHVIGGAACLA